VSRSIGAVHDGGDRSLPRSEQAARTARARFRAPRGRISSNAKDFFGPQLRADAGDPEGSERQGRARAMAIDAQLAVSGSCVALSPGSALRLGPGSIF
jgi:hypothetical protein